MTDEPLNPCPFCGGNPAMSFEDGAYYCIDCGAMPYVHLGIDPADAWNTRADPDQLPEWIIKKIKQEYYRLFEHGGIIESHRASELYWVLSLTHGGR